MQTRRTTKIYLTRLARYLTQPAAGLQTEPTQSLGS